MRGVNAAYTLNRKLYQPLTCGRDSNFQRSTNSRDLPITDSIFERNPVIWESINLDSNGYLQNELITNIPVFKKRICQSHFQSHSFSSLSLYRKDKNLWELDWLFVIFNEMNFLIQMLWSKIHIKITSAICMPSMKIIYLNIYTKLFNVSTVKNKIKTFNNANVQWRLPFSTELREVY